MQPDAASVGFFGHPLTRIVIIILVTIVVQIIVQRLLVQIVHRAVRQHHKDRSRAEERKREETLIRALRTISMVVLWIISVVVILGELHINLVALVTGAGIIGVVAGLGGQNTLQNYLSGLFITLENQCRIGDIVAISTSTGNFSGVVEDLSLRTTRLRDIDGSLHVLTNGSVGTITNYTYKYSSVLVDVIVSYDTDMDIVEKLINEVGTEIAAEEAWQEYTLEPVQFYRVNTFNDSSITVQAIGKTNTAGMQWQVAGEFRRRLHKAFRKHDIPLPYQNIVVREEPKPKQKSTH